MGDIILTNMSMRVATLRQSELRRIAADRSEQNIKEEMIETG